MLRTVLALLLFGLTSSGAAQDRGYERNLLRSQLPGGIAIAQGSNHYRDGFPAAAVAQWRQSARYGHKQAQTLLGLMYFEGSGVEQDWSSAHAWLTLASSRGDSAAIDAKARLWEVMTPGEKLAAFEAFERLQPEYGDAATLDRMTTWLRRENHRSRLQRPTEVRIPGARAGGVIIGLREDIEALVFGEFFPSYDIQYRDFRVIEDDEDNGAEP